MEFQFCLTLHYGKEEKICYSSCSTESGHVMIHSDPVIHEWLSCDPCAVECDVELYKACMSCCAGVDTDSCDIRLLTFQSPSARLPNRCTDFKVTTDQVPPSYKDLDGCE